MKEGGTTLERVLGERRGQRGGRLDLSKEREHFMAKLKQSVRIKKFRLAGSNQRQFKGHINTRGVSVLTCP